MLDFLEVEEVVGRYWHRWASRAASYPHHPEAAVDLDELRNILGVVFRAGGGEPGLEVAPIAARNSSHRLSFRQRLGFDEETVDLARRDEENLLLPPRIDLFAERTLNRDLYIWLVALMAVARRAPHSADPLQRDIAWLRTMAKASETALAAFPGLRDRHTRLCQALLQVRPLRRRLPPTEAAVESIIRRMLGDTLMMSRQQAVNEEIRELDALVRDPTLPVDQLEAPRDYRPPLPVPLWGAVIELGTQDATDYEDNDNDDTPVEQQTQADNQGKRKAQRRRQDQSERKDSLIFNRFEKMLSFAEMINVNRHVEDDDEEEARKVAEEIDEITLSPQEKRAASQLKMDLDLTPEAISGERLRGRHLYPEWNHRKQIYLPDHCAVLTDLQSEEGENWTPDEATQRRIRRVRREFEALRPRREILRGQLDGSEMDMDAAIRAHCDRAATGQSEERLYLDTRQQGRDLAVSILIDVSLSTDAWLEERRVLDVEKEALLVLGHGLAGCGDDYAIHSFTSHRRQRVWVNTLKTFDESMSEQVNRRIAALKPGRYTRMGPAIRHLTNELEQRPNRHRLLLVITDGKPNDTDYYEGRYGVEDTRRAILDARLKDIRVFGVTIDQEAQQYIPHLFGRGGYAIVRRPEQLAKALPSIYRQIIAD